MRSPYEIIKRPLLTEKGTRLKETGGHAEDDVEEGKVAPQLLFEVAIDANKIEVRKAVEQIWNVKVRDVRTQVVRGKQKRLGRYAGQRRDWKRAIVTLKPGDAIDFFEGA